MSGGFRRARRPGCASGLAAMLASHWQMPFASSRGYSSLTLQHDVAELIKRRYAKTGQRTIIYFVSDLDPSGLDLQRAWDQAIVGFGVAHCVTFVRLALTREQVRHEVDSSGQSLERLSIEVKSGDSPGDALYR
jgi:hypothetical protein